ncbi:MAG: DsbA family protein, partial [Pseudomonadota bacterium]
SHLAAQILTQLAARYDIELRCHLVDGPSGANVADAELLLSLSRYDSSNIASHYGLTFPVDSASPSPEMTQLALSILANLDGAELTAQLAPVSDALWSNDPDRLHALRQSLGSADNDIVQSRLHAGTQRRQALKHYSGAMFYYGDEWYWGIDRLHYLEARLAALGADRQPDGPLIAPCPVVTVPENLSASDLTLQFFPSIRSPYSAIVFDETIALAQKVDINLEVRPVLPMVMRGVPATREKGFYIFFDTAREARRRGVAYGNWFDPIGDPVRRCYAMYPWAVAQGRGNALLSSFMHHAFALGVNTNKTAGLRRVVQAAGLDWQAAQSHLDDVTWEALVEDNRLAMYAAGLWGVPSYRLLNASDQPLLEVWGQDRLWLVAQAITRAKS